MRIARPKLIRRPLLLALIAGSFAIPAAFAHGHHGPLASASPSRHSLHQSGPSGQASDSRQVRSERDARNEDRTASVDTGARRHQHVPDEEELEQAEQ